MTLAVADPLEALRRIHARWRPHRREAVAPEEARGRFLASPLILAPLSREREAARSLVDGYALPRGTEPGDHLFLVPGAAPAARTEREEGPSLIRVEAGEPLPGGTERVVPAEWTSIHASPRGGPPRVRIARDAFPPAGYGVLAPRQDPREIPAGTRIGPRLLAVLLEHGVSSVEVHTAEEVGLLTIGSKLTDVGHGAFPPRSPRGDAAFPPRSPRGDAAFPPRSPRGDASHGGEDLQGDLTGYWLPEAVRALGHLPHPLGIIGEGLEEGRAALLRAHGRKLRAVILAGGLGEGVRDRTLELVVRLGARLYFERVALRPGRRLLAGECLGMKLLCLGGMPLDAACAFDLFVQPALLSVLGAPPHLWDWSRARRPLGSLPASWQAAAARADGGGGEGWRRQESVDCATGRPLWSAVPLTTEPTGEPSLASADPFLPWVPDLDGWAIIPPPESREAAGTGWYFQARAPADLACPREERRAQGRAGTAARPDTPDTYRLDSP